MLCGIALRLTAASCQEVNEFAATAGRWPAWMFTFRR
jgi:hypothetical protein